MRLTRAAILSCLILTTLSLRANLADSLGFISPVDHQIRLTGNFMELRSNHFHAGIDIKSTNGQPGDRIKSVHNGHVSRIKIQSGGYGNALYIDHDNGFTSVYAHLHEFSEEIEEYITDIQYHIESFEVDVYLPDSLFRVTQGQEIGKMGNTGRSFGPHLHFELRRTKQETPVNPESLGIGPTDKIAPTLQSLHLHTLGDQGEIVGKEVRYFKNKGPEYELFEETLKLKGDRLGLGLQMYDRMDGSWNKNGIYAYQVKVDGQPVFSWRADKFSFYETRLINAFWDYQRYKDFGQKIYLLYRQHCNSFSGYDLNESDGIVDLSSGEEKTIEIIVSDLHRNRSKLSFKVVGEKSQTSSQNLTLCDSTLVRKAGNYEARFKEQSFYAPVALSVKSSVFTVGSKQLNGITIGAPNISVNGYYTLSCPAPKGDPSSWTMVSKDSKGRLIHFGGDTLGGRFVVKVDQLGEFALMKDKTAPKVEVVSLDRSMVKPWKFRVRDELIDDGKAREIAYEATVNNEWIMMKYDKKNDVLFFEDFDRLRPGSKDLRLTVWDHCGNQVVFQTTFEN